MAATNSLRGRLVRFAEAATSPLLPADYLDLFAPLRTGADLRGRVVDVHRETRDAATLVIKPGADWEGHVPGQYVRIGVDVDGVRHWRAYSLTHGPRRDGLISITVKAVPDGRVSPFLVYHCRPGTLLHLEQAAGDFVLDDDARKLLFVTAGSGVTPVIGMLRNLFPVADSGPLHLERSAELDITVIHIAPSKPESIFIDNLSELAESGAIKLIPRYDDEHGMLDIEQLADLVGDLGDRVTYACGPTGLLDAIAKHHEREGLPLQVEQFRPTVVDTGAGGTVHFGSTDTVASTDGKTSILDASEDAGVLMPSGCRMGICYGCVLPMKQGSVRDLRTGETTSTDPMSGPVKIQTCINAAAGECHLDH